MKPYHDRTTPREKLALILYRLPELPFKWERRLLKLIEKVEGNSPHWNHTGKNCPCMEEKC